MHSDQLPKFKNPPVIETVLGVQFEPLPKFGNAHLGVFWQSLGGDWQNVSDVPPLDPQFEQFGKDRKWLAAGLQLKLSQEPNFRLQIRNAENNRMIQVQNGRLHYNWLGHKGGEYPNYDKVKAEFDPVLALLKQFIASELLGKLKLQPNQWEVTYVNHIPRETVWNDTKDWVNLFQSSVMLQAYKAPIRLESFGGEWHYEIEPKQGRLHVNIRHGWHKEPEQEMLVLTLTARGPICSGDGNGLDEGLSLGHKTIVQAFKDLTSENAHKYWGLIND